VTDLTGKVALVTGASRGIGRAVAIALAQEGLDVAVNYRAREGEAQEVVREVHLLSRMGLAVQADVAVASEVARMVATVRDQLGPSMSSSTTRAAPVPRRGGISRKRIGGRSSTTTSPRRSWSPKRCCRTCAHAAGGGSSTSPQARRKWEGW
jgi:NAD(P)-dependent dehydrogenase (short-subunit alcohol dehydrogenase family)